MTGEELEMLARIESPHGRGGVAALSMQETFPAFFSEAVERSPDEVLFRRAGGGGVSYADACRWVAAIAVRLGELVPAGSAVVTYLDDTVHTAVFDLACSISGIVPAPLSLGFSPHYLRGLCRQLDTRFVLTAAGTAATVTGAGLEVLVLGPGAIGHGLPGGPEGSLAAARARVEEAARRVTPDALFMVQPTSGSTGVPKLVSRSHRAFARYARFVGHELGPSEVRPRFLAVNALTHAFGLHMFATALALGAEIAVPSALDTAAELGEVRALDPTVLPMTPRVLRSMFRQARAAGGSVASRHVFGPSARFVLSAGGVGDADLLGTLVARGIEVIEWYGSSEASIVALTPRGGWRPGTAGRIVGDVAVRVAPDGELFVRSPGLMAGYHGDAPLTEASFTEDGFYATGDLGEVDSYGYLRVLGRKRDVFNTPEGSNVYPERIETMIEALPEVDQATLVGDGRPFVAAFVVAHHDAGPEPERHARIRRGIDIINRGLEPIERIRRFVLVNNPFPAAVYTLAGAGKARRDRAAFTTVYARVIAELYEERNPTMTTHTSVQSYCNLTGLRRALAQPDRGGVAPGDVDIAHRESLGLTEAAFSDDDPDARARAERILYALNTYSGFAAPIHPALAVIWANLVRGKLAHVLGNRGDPAELTFDEMSTRMSDAVEEADRRDHPLLDRLDADGLVLYAKNWYTSTHGFEQQLISILQRSPSGVRQMLYENLGDELSAGGKPHSEMRAATLRDFGVLHDPDGGGVLGGGGAFDDPDVLTEAFSVANARTVLSLQPDSTYAVGCFYSIEAFFPDVCRRITAALRRRGVAEDNVFYWTLHNELDVGHSAEWLKGIKEAGLSDDAHARTAAGALAHMRARSELFSAMARRVG